LNSRKGQGVTPATFNRLNGRIKSLNKCTDAESYSAAFNCPLRAPGSSLLECVIMKIVAVVFALILSACGLAAQEVTVDISLESEGYLANEPLIVKVRINNQSGATLHLGDVPGWLSFAVVSTEGGYVAPLRSPELPKFDKPLDSSETAKLKVDLAPCFDLTRQGRYKVTATVKAPAFNTSFASNGKTFFISNGTKRWETKFGVPSTIAPLGADGRPELRKYSLIEANYASETRLYARVTDATDHNIRIVPIGALMSFSTVDQQTDKWMNLHILYQNGAKSFLYSVINPDGFMLARERHDFTDTRPTMYSNSEGRIGVRGGARRYTSHDIPPVNENLIGPADLAQQSNFDEFPVQPAKDSKKKPAPPENAKKK
jgi:hypothetical protein